MHELAIARADGTYTVMLARLAKLDVLVLDDFLIAPLKDTERRDLLEVLEDRYGVSSTVVTSQVPTKKWHEMLTDPSLPKTYVARAIKYQRKGFKPQTVLTSLTDAKEYPAKEVAARYHERWELELGYDEIKTKMLDRQETIRSRTVDGVGQELWRILLAYNLIRLEMERTADDLGVEPTRISFVSAMRLICDTWVWCSIASAGAIPTRLKTMREFFTRLVLPARRSNRSYPRAVKIKMSNYARKRPLPRARA